MINLLPNDRRLAIVYARRNTRLLHWIGGLLVGFSGIMLIILFGFFYIHQSTNTYNKRIAASQDQLRIQKLDDTETRVKDISGSLKLVVQVLGREVLFSELLQQIGSAMPQGSSLSSLNINKVTGGIDLNAVAKDYQTASQVQVNLQDPANKIFQKADIVSINCSTKSNDPNYPCQIALRALFAKNNPFLFIHKPGAKP